VQAILPRSYNDSADQNVSLIDDKSSAAVKKVCKDETDNCGLGFGLVSKTAVLVVVLVSHFQSQSYTLGLSSSLEWFSLESVRTWVLGSSCFKF